MKSLSCYHCGAPVLEKNFKKEGKNFCCSGCVMVYKIIHQQHLESFYTHFPKKGVTPKKNKQPYTFLADKEMWKAWINFQEGTTLSVSLFIPSIHCSACIWILEHLHQIEPGILHSHVTFSTRSLHLVFDEEKKSMLDVVRLLNQLGYPPDFSLEGQKQIENKKRNRALWLKIGIAGFAFGNTMFLAIATYFEQREPWLDQLRPWFDTIMFVLSVPVVIYSAQDYFIHSVKSIRKQIWSLDIPIALGISVLFLKSTHAIFIAHELPYFDSLTGLVFFLLLGQYMQQSVYSASDFEHKYASFFPIGVTVIHAKKEDRVVAVGKLKKGNCMFLRPEEIIPVDGIVKEHNIHVDYSFVTGESDVVLKKKGEAVYAGGRIKEQGALITVSKTMDESFLLQLWEQDLTQKKDSKEVSSFSDQISRYFTPIILLISAFAGIGWLFIDPSKAIEVVVAVLIVACPCALALSSPFIFGNMVRYFGSLGFLMKNNSSIEKIAGTKHWVLDKTGTLTDVDKTSVFFKGATRLSKKEKQVIKSMAHQSTHPLSVAIFRHLSKSDYDATLVCSQVVGGGITTCVDEKTYMLGSARFLNYTISENTTSSVHIAINNTYRGVFEMKQYFRDGIRKIFEDAPVDRLSIVSGDNAKDKKSLKSIVSPETAIYFEQDPFAKVAYVKSLQATGDKVLMVGDGLNDAGALMQSDAGVAVRSDMHMFTPKCDAILNANKVIWLAVFYWGMKQSIRLVRISFGFSLLYNFIGIGIAVAGVLNPVIAAILMPLSSISVVVFASLSTAHLNKQLQKKINS